MCLSPDETYQRTLGGRDADGLRASEALLGSFQLSIQSYKLRHEPGGRTPGPAGASGGGGAGKRKPPGGATGGI